MKLMDTAGGDPSASTDSAPGHVGGCATEAGARAASCGRDGRVRERNACRGESDAKHNGAGAHGRIRKCTRDFRIRYSDGTGGHNRVRRRLAWSQGRAAALRIERERLR